MCQLRDLADDYLCRRRRGCPLNSQLIGYGFDSPPLRRLCADTTVRNLSADSLIYATLRHFDANRFAATVKACQDMTSRLLCQMLQYAARAEKDYH